MTKDLETKFELHYYLKDNSHSMNAFVRNRAEKDFLEALMRIGLITEQDFKIDSEAYEEGGLKQKFIITALIGVATYFSPSINNIITHFVTKNAALEKLDLKIKEETLKSMQLDNKKKEIEIEKIIDEKLNDKLTIRHISNFYKKIEAYQKIQQIGFKSLNDNSNEYIVDRKYFKNFILVDDITVNEDDNAMIEIISPILKEGKYHWRGNYKNEKIDFSMADSKFKQEVIEGKHKFSNGSLINCHLEIKITFDEFGDEKGKNYRVLQVFGTKELEFGELKLREAGKKRKYQKWVKEHQGNLFHEIEEENES